MEFRVLGPVEVRSDRGRLQLGNSRERKILAALLLDAGHVVPLARLVDTVWDEDPPQTAAKAVRNCVSTLRGRLVAAGGSAEMIATDPAGYAVRLAEDDAFDLRTFARHVSEARRLAASGEPEAAVERFRAALALWRGGALAGMTGRIVQAAAARLDEQRLTVVEECLAVELALGRDHQLVDELSALVAAQPLRERLRGQLMLALHRGGRRTEALECYRQGYSVLVGELGIEPGPALVELHRAILAGDLVPASHQQGRAGGAGVAGGAGNAGGIGGIGRAGRPTPAQLPMDLRAFAGRDSELAELDALLDPAALASTVVISALSGTAGVGKTALAVHWSHRVAARFPDGQLYVNLRGFDPSGPAMPPAEAIRGFLDALGVPAERIPSDLHAQAALYRSHLAGRRVLVVLDNARDAEQVRPLLPGTPGCLVLVTSRDQLTGLVTVEGAHVLTVGLPARNDARRLFARRVGAGRVAAEPHAVDQIITRCGRLPLALAIVATRAATSAGLMLASLAVSLGEARRALDAFADRDAVTDVRAVFSWSYQALSPASAQLFRLLGVHPGPDIGAPAVASVAGIPVAEARPLLAELTSAHLVVQHTRGRYVMHDLLRAYAAELAGAHDSEAQRLAATLRTLDHYLHTAYGAARLLFPHRDPLLLATPHQGTTPECLTDEGRAGAWFAAELPILTAAIRHAADAGLHAHTWQLAWTLTTFLERRGAWQELVAIQQIALGATVRASDLDGQARAHRYLALAHVQLGRYDDAHDHLRHALDCYGRLGDGAGLAHTHSHLALVLDRQGRHHEALDQAERGLGLYRAAAHPAGEAEMLNMVGWCHAQLGDYRSALDHCGQALALQQRLDDRHGQADVWDSLGYAHHHLGDHQQAVKCYGHALDLFGELGDRPGKAHVLMHLGDTHHAAGDLDAAHRVWRQALEFMDEVGHADAAVVRAKLGSSLPT